MKALLTTTLTVLLISLTATAQKRKCGNETQPKRHHDMANKLNLTPEQKEQSKKIHTAYKAEQKALQANDKQTVASYNASLATLQANHKQQMQAVLTPEQKIHAEAYQKEKQTKHEAKHAKQLTKLQTQLQLTDAQMKQLQVSKAENKTKIDAIKNNNSLTHEQKKDQVKALKIASKNSLSNSLTDAQKDQLKSMKGNKKYKPVNAK